MSLAELWKNSPDQFANKQVQQIIGFAAEGVLRNNSGTSSEFREFLSIIPVEFLGSFADDCLDRSFTNSGFALQDIINELGRRLGFEVEDGLYQGTRSDIGFDGLWKLPSDHHVVVEVKTTDTYRIDIDKIAEYRRKLAAEQRIDEDRSSILLIVGRDDTGDLEAQIRGSRHAWDVRLISISSLLRLLFVKDSVDDPQIVQRICEILIPKEFTRLDHIVDIVFSATEDAGSDEDEEFEEELLSGEVEMKEVKHFSRSEKSVTFNEACVMHFAEVRNAPMIRKSRTTYESPDKTVRVVSLVSRDYEKLKEKPDPQHGAYWFGYRSYHKDFAESASDGYLILGCGSPDVVLAINAEIVEQWLPDLNTSTKYTGTIHWHFHIFRDGDRYFIEKKQGLGRVDVTEYLVKPKV